MAYDALIGTGGIGAGQFFALRGNHTLGREESRGGRFLDRRDYCKLHIIAHVVAALAPPGFTTLPIGAVGDDAAGEELLAEMRAAGMAMQYILRMPATHTLFSFCFLYPDGSGGNLTVDDSASARLSPEHVRAAEPSFAQFAGRGIALAAPEVPLDVRAELLSLGRRHDFLCVASFTTGEILQADAQAMIKGVDLLVLNGDEAAAFGGVAGEPPETVVEAAIDALRRAGFAGSLSVTAGSEGSWFWDGQALSRQAAHQVDVVGSAGAGDAYLGALLAGYASGLPAEAARELAGLTAAVSVTSPHTIHPGISRRSLAAFARDRAIDLSPAAREALSAP